MVDRGGRNSEYRATVDSERFQGELGFGDPGPLLETLQVGDKAVATVWRGDIVALTKDGVRQKTSDEPRGEPQMIAAGGAGLGLLAVLGLVFGTARLVAPRNPGTFTWSGRRDAQGPGRHERGGFGRCLRADIFQACQAGRVAPV
ncbi:hypothetical protein AB0P36_35115 [Streptomyces flavidovirens]|uniref:hypothetical protein n=1 Tax=Streptomyces flavidovirens TaxID=67298 RepID=UPI003424E492